MEKFPDSNPPSYSEAIKHSFWFKPSAPVLKNEPIIEISIHHYDVDDEDIEDYNIKPFLIEKFKKKKFIG